MEDIFEKAAEIDHNNTKRIGIVGQPGIGKSTLCKSIVEMVLNSTILRDVKYVFFILLRHIRTHNSPTALLKFITRTCNISWTHDATQDHALLRKINESNDVLFVLDGFDECKISHDEITQESDLLAIDDEATPLHFIKCLLRGDIFPNSIVLMTSR